MRKMKTLIGVLALLFITVFAWSGLTNAHSFKTGDNITVGPGEKIEDTLFVAGRTVDINSEVFGDVFCTGQTITVSGTVHGDVICAGQTVNVTGVVDGDVRLAGQTVTVGASVSGNATIAGQSFNLESTGEVKGDVSVGSTDATINGPVGRHIAVGGSNLTLSSTVGGNVKSAINNLTLASSARVAGNIEYTSNNELSQADGAVVTGEITRNIPPKKGASKRGAVFGFGFAWFIYWYLAMLFTALAIALLFPRMLQTVSNRAIPTPWKALLVGFLAALFMPVLLIVLAITVIGLPLAFMIGLIWLVIIILSGPLFGYYIGRLILRDSTQPLLIMLVGASVLLVLYFIPFLGFLAVLAATWIGAGMLLIEMFSRTPKPAYNLATNKSSRR